MTRLMPICAAKAVTLTPKSSSQPVSSSPGCAGLCIFMVCLSVVIQIIQKLYILTDKPERHSPIGLHRQGIKTGTVARQTMHAPRRTVQVWQATGDMQGGQQFAQALGVNRLYACHAARLEKRFKPFVPECEYHKLLSL